MVMALSVVITLAVCLRFSVAETAEESPIGGEEIQLLKKLFDTEYDRAWLVQNPITIGDSVTVGLHWSPIDTANEFMFGPTTIGTVVAAVNTTVYEIEWRNPTDEATLTSQSTYGNGRYDVAVKKEKLVDVPSVNVVENVPKLNLSGPVESMFAELASVLDRPLMLVDTVASNWGAMKWTPKDLVNGMGQLNGVKVAHDKPHFYYYHRAPMNLIPNLVQDYKKKTFSKHPMQADDFLDRTVESAKNEESESESEMNKNVLLRENREDNSPAPRHTNGLFYSWAGKLDDLGIEKLADVSPIYPFMVLSPEFNLAEEQLFRSTHVWISPKESVTPAHYDIAHNFFIQMKGRKRVLMFPPESWQLLYLHPILHPASLSAQVNLNADFESQRSQFPFLPREGISAYVADLGPGDVLYIPPLWLHHVTTIESSISMSVWTPFAGSDLYDKILKEQPLPIQLSWSHAWKVAALRMLIDSLVTSLDLEDMDAAQFIDWTLMQNRYINISDEAEQSEKSLKFCWNRETEDEVMFENEEELIEGLTSTLKMFQKLYNVSGINRGHIFLANYIELSVQAVVGTTNTRAFLHSMTTDDC
eukprot:m.20604 g.20604  ORF g.20604 m.20604 type:complete len:588 (-) comp13004_c0_seq1:46-1809(-)